MQFKKVEKKCEGKFITRYDITYETVDHQEKVYEMISRNGDITDFEGLHGKMADAVVIIATDETGEKILIDKEFRLAPRIKRSGAIPAMILKKTFWTRCISSGISLTNSCPIWMF